MPPRLQPSSRAITSVLRVKHPPFRAPRQYGTTVAIESPLKDANTTPTLDPIARYPRNQPPSYKPAKFRKTQLLRQYASLLRSSPLMLLFQHNNLKSSEWMSIRRELTKAFQKVDEAQATASSKPVNNVAAGVKIQIIQTGIFAAALRVVEFFKPDQVKPVNGSGTLTHTLSKVAHDVVVNNKAAHALAPLLSGPLVVLTFPTVSPQHLKAALSVLAPCTPLFPAPTRKANPGWHEQAVQTGLQKLVLLGARVEGRVFDADGAKWVGGIEGGLEGLREQLVHLFQSIGTDVANALETTSRNLYFTVETRRSMLEDESKPDEKQDEIPKRE